MFEDGQQPTVGSPLDSLTRRVDMSGSVLHHDEEFVGFRINAMLPSVQRTTVENGVPGVPIQGSKLCSHSAHAIRVGATQIH